MLSKKVLQFILLTFLISWSVALAAYLLHITCGSILFFVIIAVCYMPAPAYATLILQKLVYRSTLQPYGFTQKYIAALALNSDRRLRMVHRPGNICSHCHPGKRLRDSSLWQD